MNGLILALEKYKKRRLPFSESDEHAFYIKNKSLIDKAKKLNYLMFPDNEFDIMRANIVITSILNKMFIEKEVNSLLQYSKTNYISPDKFLETIKEKLVDLPYFTYKTTKIYVPIFSLAVNSAYNLKPDKIFSHPYDILLDNFEESTIDPFDTYGSIMFDSYFTKLINIGHDDNGNIAFFHYSTNTIYIVNYQGRLDVKIVLFDKFIKRPNYNHMLERLKPVVNAYFDNDRNGFVEALLNSKFISNKLLTKIK